MVKEDSSDYKKLRKIWFFKEKNLSSLKNYISHHLRVKHFYNNLSNRAEGCA